MPEARTPSWYFRGAIFAASALFMLSFVLTLWAASAVAPRSSACMSISGKEHDFRPLLNARTWPDLCPFVLARGLDNPRGLAVLPDASRNYPLLVAVEGKVLILMDSDGDNESTEQEWIVLTSAPGLNHGLVVAGPFAQQNAADYYDIYVSSATTVFRCRWFPNAVLPLVAQAVVIDIPAGGHRTRTPAFGPDGMLYVSIGSVGNVDTTSFPRASVWRFDVSGSVPVSFAGGGGELYAHGMRNEVGLRFDQSGTLWGVENGVDKLERADLGGAILHQDNPAEELNNLGDPRSTRPGRFFGYPQCWSEYWLPEIAIAAEQKRVPRRQWVHPQFASSEYTDTWCRNGSRVVPPTAAMPAHVAPLDIVFYEPARLAQQSASSPVRHFASLSPGDAVVSFHGSWNRDPAQGYRVVRVKFVDDPANPGQRVATNILPLLWYDSQNTGNVAAYASDMNVFPQRDDDRWPHRPVGLTFRDCYPGAPPSSGRILDCLFITSDASGMVLGLRPT